MLHLDLTQLLEPLFPLAFLWFAFAVYSCWQVCFPASFATGVLDHGWSIFYRHAGIPEIPSEHRTHGNGSLQILPNRLFLSKLQLFSNCETNAFSPTSMPQGPWCVLHAILSLDRMYLLRLPQSDYTRNCFCRGLCNWISLNGHLSDVTFLSEEKLYEPWRSQETWRMAWADLLTLQT